MGGLFGGGKAPQAQKQQPAGALNVQTSIYGSAYPLVYGKNRVPVNLIHYINFRAIAHTTKQKTGGKGGGKAQSNTTYTYTVAMAAGMAVGGIAGVGTIWKNKEKHTAASLGLTVFNGGAGQTPWSYLSGAYPAQAVPYANLAYIASPSLDLGDSPSLPNLNVEVKGLVPYQAGTIDDALASDIVTDYLTNARHGAGFGAYLSDLDAGGNSFRKYCLARGLFLSPIENNQRNAGAFLKDIAEICNAAIVWQNGKLNFIPYGDAAITGNGATFTPNLTPLYDLTMDDFLVERGQPPVKHSAKNPSQQFNHVRIEYAARENDYNPLIVEVKDQADIDDNGLRTKAVTKYTAITQRPLARDVAQLQMQRDLFVVNSYSFRLGVRHSLLEPMDLVTITEPALGLDRQLVRITEVTEQDDAIDVTVEEMNVGVANAPLYNTVGPGGYNQDFNAAPGNTQDPLIMNAPGLLTQTGYEMWINVAGVNASLWGGCQVWISDDDTDYRYVGTVAGPARYGALAAAMSTGTADYDTTSVLRVQLYNGQVLSGTQEDCDDFRTLLYVGGEWMSYRDATLVSGSTYDLDTFRRSAYGSVRAAHAAGQAVAVIDEATFRLPYDAGNVGKTVYFKFPSFNVFGAGVQDLASVPAYSHTIGASELTAPMIFADIGGNGVNLLPDQYSTLESATVPPVQIGNGTLTREFGGIASIVPGSGVYRLTATAADNYIYLGQTYNIPHTRGKRYLVSAYFASSSEPRNIEAYVQMSNGDHIALGTKVKTISGGLVNNRFTWMADLASRTEPSFRIRFDNEGGSGSIMYFDAVMVEEAVGLLEQPSAYSRGQAGSMAVSAIAAAAAAQDTADGVVDTFYSSTAPSGAKLGDYWYDSSNGNRVNRYNGSSWVLVQDTAIPAAISAAAGAQATADGKVKTFYALSSAPPTPSGLGDLWYQTDTKVLYRWNNAAWLVIGDNSADAVAPTVINPSFEQGTVGWSINSGTGMSVGTGPAISGSNVMIKAGGTAACQWYNTNPMSCSQGDRIISTCAVRHANAGGTFSMLAYFYDSNGSYLTGVNGTVLVNAGNLAANTWKQVREIFTAPVGAASVRFGYQWTGYSGSNAWNVDQCGMRNGMRDIGEAATGIPSAGRNLVSNGNFVDILVPLNNPTTNDTTIAKNWTKHAGTAANTYIRMVAGYGGLPGYQMQVNIDGQTIPGNSSVYSDFAEYRGPMTFTPGQKVRLAARLWINFNTGIPAGCSMVGGVLLAWYDVNGTYLGQTQAQYTFQGANGTAAATAVVPAGTVKYRLLVQTWIINGNAGAVTIGGIPIEMVVTDIEALIVNDMDTAVDNGVEYGKTHNNDLMDVGGIRRIGLRITNSGQRLGSQRNTVRAQTSTYGSVRTATALTGVAGGSVNVNAHTVNYGSFTVTYNAVTAAVTGLATGSTYVIYCYDGDYSGGTKTYFAGTNPAAVMALGDDIIVIGQVLIPASGSSGGGGGGTGTNPGDWCVAADSFLPDGTLAEDLLPGELLPCYNNLPEEPGIVELITQANRKADAECLRMSTVSGASIVASTTTPMTLRDGSCVLLPDMLGREALVHRLDGSFQWEEVVALAPVGVRRVAKISVSDQCYFAGETMDAFIATHNVQQMKP